MHSAGSAASTGPRPPVLYRIRLKGGLGQHRLTELGRMDADHTAIEGGVHVTELIRQLPDQAALVAMLNAFYDDGMCLISFRRLDSPPLAPP